MADLVRREIMFVATEIVEVNHPFGKAVGAKQDVCSDSTKAMLIQPNDPKDEWQIEELRRALNLELDKPKA